MILLRTASNMMFISQSVRILRNCLKECEKYKGCGGKLTSTRIRKIGSISRIGGTLKFVFLNRYMRTNKALNKFTKSIIWSKKSMISNCPTCHTL